MNFNHLHTCKSIYTFFFALPHSNWLLLAHLNVSHYLPIPWENSMVFLGIFYLWILPQGFKIFISVFFLFLTKTFWLVFGQACKLGDVYADQWGCRLMLRGCSAVDKVRKLFLTLKSWICSKKYFPCPWWLELGFLLETLLKSIIYECILDWFWEAMSFHYCNFYCCYNNEMILWIWYFVRGVTVVRRPLLDSLSKHFAWFSRFSTSNHIIVVLNNNISRLFI